METPKSALEIDLGPVTRIEPVQNIPSFAQISFPETTSHDVQTFFGSENIVSRPRHNPNSLVTSDDKTPAGVAESVSDVAADNDRNEASFVTVAAADTIVGDADNALEIPVIIEEETETESLAELIKDNHVTDTFQFEEHPAAKTTFERLQLQSGISTAVKAAAEPEKIFQIEQNNLSQDPESSVRGFSRQPAGVGAAAGGSGAAHG